MFQLQFQNMNFKYGILYLIWSQQYNILLYITLKIILFIQEAFLKVKKIKIGN